MKIFVTGATGFIGSHLARALVSAGYEVAALRREKSNLSRCADYAGKIDWINGDSARWQEAVVAFKPEIIIHAAWAGVTAAERADWRLQATNLNLFSDLLLVASAAGTARFVALGSQAEYGPINGRVDETYPCLPDTAYGAAKQAALALLQGFSRQRELSYVWLRLFSLYGPDEGGQWLISMLVRELKQGRSPQLSGCEQRYDYLHVQDLSAAVLAVLRRPAISGVFNLGSNEARPLKELVLLIKEYTGCRAEPGFGVLPYRPGQSMHVEGDSSRFYQAFSFQPQISIQEGLRQLCAVVPAAGSSVPI